mgnify:FL=1
MASILGGPSSWGATLSPQSRDCLVCHGKGVLLRFQQDKPLQSKLSATRLAASVHGALECSACHRAFSAREHPQRIFRSWVQYRARASLACRRCHQDIGTQSIHASLFSQELAGETVICSDCHGAHYVEPVKGQAISEEKLYCMQCHQHPLKLLFKDGTVFEAMVKEAELRASVHRRLNCSDCHYGYSAEEHPQRRFRSQRDYSIALSETCRRCHFDKYTTTLESIHYQLLSQGNMKAPVCTDCHGAHLVVDVSGKKAAIAHRCQKCHPGVFEVYVSSVHGSALLNEANRDVPVCTDCHRAHNIQNPLDWDYREQIPQMCAKCHANEAVMSKYGLSTQVVQTYLSDFHGVTLSLYRKQRKAVSQDIAVCTDCHGTHDIGRTRSPDAAVIKANLLQRCRKCHPKAGEDFPDAWLSHYEPSLGSTPVLYIASLLFKLFIPVLLVGLGLQIALHIWRYAVSR